ncbi:MAG: sodium-translocating pyrophosphatase [Deltaproteobacteria bacterium RBG_16_49_23]|nr:MAG: sodium-translocating pyrophosphatase [Deltaproteobacteria bacterium RBG_16_49_23]
MVWIGVAGLTGIIALIFVFFTAKKVMRQDPGTPQMVAISDAVYEGAMAFLKREYRAISIFAIIVAILLAIGLKGQGWHFSIFTALSYLVGAACSLTAGYVGLSISTRANTRTAQGATKGFNQAMSVAFPGGAVMGLTVVGLGLLAFSAVFLILGQFAPGGLVEKMTEAAGIIAGFSMGASSVALFARVGGGIYTKAADVGADLVGKVEAGIPEDDPRNPATIADNVGDNVGDVAGMGADLYESYIGSLLSGVIIAVSTLATPELKIKGVVLSFLLYAVGIIASILGVFFVRTGEKADPGKALNNGTISSAVFYSISSFFLVLAMFGWDLSYFFASFSGIVAGMVIGFTAYYYTSGKSVQKLAKASTTGSATTIIHGFALSCQSTVIPLVVIGISILISFKLGGFFGIALAAIGMLATTGMVVAVDAYGPIADNSGGIAEMAHMGKEIRKITDSLDSAGNTTAAIAKGFAIGSAALTALALFLSYTQVMNLSAIDLMGAGGYKIMAGVFIGAIIPYFFAGATMMAVGRAAFNVVEEVRRQFREIKGLMEGTAKAEYARCVDITTAGALKEMIVPGIAAVAIPILLGGLLGPEALAGVLLGSLATGVPLAIQMANAGGAWDNAKKWIEEGNLGGKGSDTHKAAVVGDTVGDPFKDTSAPSMNILLKLMTVVSLVFGPMILGIHKWLISLF